MITPPVGPHMQAKHFRTDRSRGMFPGKVLFLGIHTAEGGSKAEDLGNFFQDTDRQVSSHCGIGQDGHYVSYVSYDHSAFTMPPVNDNADQVELLGWARWTREEWLKHGPMLQTLGRWIAWRCEVRGFQVKVLNTAQALAGEPGLLMHRIATDAWHKSTHTDPGLNLPWDQVIAIARDITQKESPPVAEEPTHDPAVNDLLQDEVPIAPLKALLGTGPHSKPVTDFLASAGPHSQGSSLLRLIIAQNELILKRLP